METGLILEGKASGVVRRYGESCPHEPGNEIVFTSKYLAGTKDPTQEVPFAKGQVVSVRPGTVGQFRKDKMLAEKDGYANGNVWYGHMSQLYKGISDDTQVHHVSFRIVELDKTNA